MCPIVQRNTHKNPQWQPEYQGELKFLSDALVNATSLSSYMSVYNKKGFCSI